eukprot:7163116-Karenia_brevis.AAC.1
MFSFIHFQGLTKKGVFGDKGGERAGPRGEGGTGRAENSNGSMIRQSLSMYAVRWKYYWHANTY